MDAFLKKKPSSKESEESTPILSPILTSCTELTSDDPNVSAFYAQLTDRERTAHKIAVEKLGTSYDVTRTHGYVKWSKNKTV